jgi:hypothetical protein
LLIAAAAFASSTLPPELSCPTAAAKASQPEISGAASGGVGATQFIAGATAAAIVGVSHPGTVVGMVSTTGVFVLVCLGLGIALDLRRPVAVPAAHAIKRN